MCLVIVVQVVLVLSCGQTDTQTDADEHFTPATLFGMRNQSINQSVSQYNIKRELKKHSACLSVS